MIGRRPQSAREGKSQSHYFQWPRHPRQQWRESADGDIHVPDWDDLVALIDRRIGLSSMWLKRLELVEHRTRQTDNFAGTS